MKLSETRHLAARAILDGDRPFAFLLRTYAKTMPWRRNLQNEVYDELSPEMGVLSIRGNQAVADAEEQESNPQFRARCPALTVSNEEWQAVARNLIRRATFVICEVWEDTPGVSLELSMCRQQDRSDETVLLVPQPSIDQLNCYDTFEGFWRLSLYQDLDGCSLFTHPSTRSLPLREEPIDLRSRNGVPFIIPELIQLAFRYIKASDDWGHASVHAQNAWNIGVRLAEMDASMSLAERDGLVNAACMLAHRLAQFNRLKDARDKLDVAKIFCSERELQHHIARIDEMRRRLDRQVNTE